MDQTVGTKITTRSHTIFGRLRTNCLIGRDDVEDAVDPQGQDRECEYTTAKDHAVPPSLA